MTHSIESFVIPAGVDSTWVANRSGSYQLQSTDQFQITANLGEPYGIRVVNDEKPSVIIERDLDRFTYTPQARVPLKMLVQDDLRLHWVQLRYRIVDQFIEGDPIDLFRDNEAALTTNRIFSDHFAHAPDQREIDAVWDLATIRELKPETKVTLYVVAADYKPQQYQTEHIQLRLVSKDDLLLSVESKNANVASQLEAVAQSQQRAFDRAVTLRHNLMDKQFEPPVERVLETLATNQRRIQQRLFDQSQSIAQKIGDLIRQLEMNRLNETELHDQLSHLNSTLRELDETTSSQVADQLQQFSVADAIDLETSSRESVIDALQSLAELQQHIIDTVRESTSSLVQWDDFRQFMRDVENTIRQQEMISAGTDRLRQDTLGKDRSSLTEQENDSLQDLARDQQTLTRQVQSLLADMQLASNGLDSSEVTTARRLRNSVQAANAHQLTRHMLQSSESLSENQLGKARRLQSQTQAGLASVLSALSDTSINRSDLLAQQQQAMSELQSIQRQLAQLEFNQMERAAASIDAKRHIHDSTNQLANQLDQMQARSAGQYLDNATERIAESMQHDSSGDNQSSLDSLTQAGHQMSQAKQALAEALKTARAKLARQRQLRLQQDVAFARDEQRSINARTERFATDKGTSDWSRAQRAQIRLLSNAQRVLHDSIDQLRQDYEMSGAFLLATAHAMTAMHRSARNLNKADTTPATLTFQTDALQRLQQMVQSLNIDRSEPEELTSSTQNENEPSRPEEAITLHDMTQLKLLRLMQKSLNEKTFTLRSEEPGSRTTDWHKAQRELAIEQGELADSLVRINEIITARSESP